MVEAGLASGRDIGGLAVAGEGDQSQALGRTAGANAAANSHAAPAAEHDSLPELPDVPLEEYLEGIERRAIMRALELERWNRTAAAKRLGMTFRSLRYRLKKLGID